MWSAQHISLFHSPFSSLNRYIDKNNIKFIIIQEKYIEDTNEKRLKIFYNKIIIPVVSCCPVPSVQFFRVSAS